MSNQPNIVEIMQRIEELPDREAISIERNCALVKAVMRQGGNGDPGKEATDKLKREVDEELSGRPYRNGFRQRGIEPCGKCEDTVLMGEVEVVGVNRKAPVQVSYREAHDIAKHYDPSKHDPIIQSLTTALDSK